MTSHKKSVSASDLDPGDTVPVATASVTYADAAKSPVAGSNVYNLSGLSWADVEAVPPTDMLTSSWSDAFAVPPTEQLIADNRDFFSRTSDEEEVTRTFK